MEEVQHLQQQLDAARALLRSAVRGRRGRQLRAWSGPSVGRLASLSLLGLPLHRALAARHWHSSRSKTSRAVHRMPCVARRLLCLLLAVACLHALRGALLTQVFARRARQGRPLPLPRVCALPHHQLNCIGLLVWRLKGVSRLCSVLALFAAEELSGTPCLWHLVGGSLHHPKPYPFESVAEALAGSGRAVAERCAV